jgi:hypothetical protein
MSCFLATGEIDPRERRETGGFMACYNAFTAVASGRKGQAAPFRSFEKPSHPEGIHAMTRLMTALALILLMQAPALAADTAPAQTFQDGVAAVKRGDYDTALAIFKPLADAGDAPSQTNLGMMYSRGWGVPVNEAEAVKWYRLAANKGQPIAQNNLGAMYMAGKGGPKDIVIGLMWLMLAAENGYEKAKIAVDHAKQDVTPREFELAKEFTVLYRKKWAIARKEVS